MTPADEIKLAPPEPTGDPFLDEVRRLKWEASARFNHDLERIKARWRELERDHPGGVVRPSADMPGRVA